MEWGREGDEERKFRKYMAIDMLSLNTVKAKPSNVSILNGSAPD